MDTEIKKPGRKTPTMLLTEAARRLKYPSGESIGYANAYDYYMRARLKGWKRKKKIHVTVSSVDALQVELSARATA